MELWINIIFAWIALILSFLLVIIWVLRLICKKRKPLFLYRINRALRKHHKLIGILLIAAALIHGLFSSDDLLSFNWGTANWIISILLGLSWMLRKKLNMKKTWMSIHRLLTLAFVTLIVIHILNVGGFILDDMIFGKMSKPPVPPAQTKQEESAPENVTAAPLTTPEPLQTADTLPALLPEETQIATSSPAPTETSGDMPIYQDGVYQGTGTGYRPGLVVEVTIQYGSITSVTIIDHNEKNEMYWGVPIEEIPKTIVEAQSTDVDSISGATMTSDGIKQAVEDALSKALGG